MCTTLVQVNYTPHTKRYLTQMITLMISISSIHKYDLSIVWKGPLAVSGCGPDQWLPGPLHDGLPYQI